jgi:hypothetical protein
MADTETLQTVADFVTASHISMTVERTDANPNMDMSNDMDHWKCKITRKWQSCEYHERQTGKAVRYTRESSMTVTFSMGMGHHGAEPDIASVLDCLASDANGVDNARSFEDWAGDYGYDTDSRKAEKKYRACVSSRDKLKRFLGDALYQTLLYGTERM